MVEKKNIRLEKDSIILSEGDLNRDLFINDGVNLLISKIHNVLSPDFRSIVSVTQSL